MNEVKLQWYFVRRIGPSGPLPGCPPIACVALAVDVVGVVSRGISICSHMDSWTRKVGRIKAGKRARSAAGRQHNKSPDELREALLEKELTTAAEISGGLVKSGAVAGLMSSRRRDIRRDLREPLAVPMRIFPMQISGGIMGVHPAVTDFCSVWVSAYAADPPNYKSEYDVTLTGFEKHVLGKAKERWAKEAAAEISVPSVLSA